MPNVSQQALIYSAVNAASDFFSRCLYHYFEDHNRTQPISRDELKTVARHYLDSRDTWRGLIRKTDLASWRELTNAEKDAILDAFLQCETYYPFPLSYRDAYEKVFKIRGIEYK